MGRDGSVFKIVSNMPTRVEKVEGGNNYNNSALEIVMVLVVWAFYLL